MFELLYNKNKNQLIYNFHSNITRSNSLEYFINYFKFNINNIVEGINLAKDKIFMRDMDIGVIDVVKCYNNELTAYDKIRIISVLVYKYDITLEDFQKILIESI